MLVLDLDSGSPCATRTRGFHRLASDGAARASAALLSDDVIVVFVARLGSHITPAARRSHLRSRDAFGPLKCVLSARGAQRRFGPAPAGPRAPGPARSLPAKLVSEHVVRKGVCVCETRAQPISGRCLPTLRRLFTTDAGR